MLSLTTMGWILLVFGILAVLVAAFLKGDKHVRELLGIVGVFLVVLVLFVPSFSASTQTIAPVSGATVQVTGITATSGVTVYNATQNTLQVAAKVTTTSSTANFTSGFPTNGLVKFHFDIMRTDQGTSAAVFGVNLASNPQIYNSTNSKSYYLIQQYTGNKTNEVTIGSFEGGQALYSVPSAGSVQVNVSMTLNAFAISSMQLYGSTPLVFDVELVNSIQQVVTVNVVFAQDL